MSQFKDRVQKFYQGEYDSFDAILKEERDAVLKETASLFVEKLDVAIESIVDSKVDAVVALNEGHEHLLKLVQDVDDEKAEAFLEGYERSIAMLAVECDDEDITTCKKCLEVIKEEFTFDEPVEDVAVSDEPSTEVEPVVENDEIDENVAPAAVTAGSVALKPDALGTPIASDEEVAKGLKEEYTDEHGNSIAPKYEVKIKVDGDKLVVDLYNPKTSEWEYGHVTEDLNGQSPTMVANELMDEIGRDEYNEFGDSAQAIIDELNNFVHQNSNMTESQHDPIPGIDGNDVGAELNAVPAEEVVDDPEAMPNPDSFTAQHEKVVGGEKATQGSGYEAGFAEGRKLWKKGANIKKMAQQLAETEYADQPYGYVTRFQEGVIAGFSFQEEVIRDTNPDLLEEDEIDSEK